MTSPRSSSAQPIVVAARPRDSDIVSFYRKLFLATPRVYIAHSIVAANVLVFAIMVISGVDMFSPTTDAVLSWGGNFGPKTLAGEWWRLASCTFLHFGLIHIGINMWVFWDIGQLVERMVGNIGLLVVYLFSGVFASLCSVIWHPNAVGAGASGAVFGMFGLLLGFLALRKRDVPIQILRSLQSSGSTFLIYNLIFGLTAQGAGVGIDNVAHLGGFVAGFLGGLVVSQSLDAKELRFGRTIRNSAVLVGGAAIIISGIILAPDAPIDVRVESQKVWNKINQLQSEFYDAQTKFDNEQLTNDDVLAMVRKQILPEWKLLRERIDTIAKSESANDQYFAKWKDFVRERQVAWEIFIDVNGFADVAKLQAVKEHWIAADKLLADLNRGG